MRVLYVTGSNLGKNTSANMSHNGYVQGLLENGATLDIIMADDSYGEADTKLKNWEGVRYSVYSSLSWVDKLRRKGRNVVKVEPSVNAESSESVVTSHNSLKLQLRGLIKKLFYTIFKPDPIYPLDKTWLKNASNYTNKEVYDIIVSNSSPAASHRLVAELLKKNRIKCKRWIQIWEDPWYNDLYGGHTEKELLEEHSLLKSAQEVYYVSPLTLHYQKKYFQDCADKMAFIPLPYLQFSANDTISNNAEISFGYFGDYYSHTRNLRPFYEALLTTGAKGNIFGDTNLKLKSTEKVKVSGRVTLDILEKVQNETSVLVHICNLRGGQIPGKIYHYSATAKPILFILDGSEEEQKIIRDFFSQYNRYYFCSNNIYEIENAIRKMTANISDYNGHVVYEFSPKQVVSRLLFK